MKRLLYFLLLVCLTAKATTYPAASWNDVQTLHDSTVSNGDTIEVASGSYTVSTPVAITKAVRITCAGACTLTDNSSNTAIMITFTESTAGSVRFDGFDIIQGTGVHSNPYGVIKLIATSGGEPILIQGNTYSMVTTSGDLIIADTNKGVIRGNTQTAIVGSGLCFNNASFVRHKVNSGNSWSTGPSHGALDSTGRANLYIENNTLNRVAEAIDVDDRGRVVIRYNQIMNGAAGSHGADTSGLGSREMEVYGNTFVWDITPQTTGGCPNVMQNVNAFIAFRGGGGNYIFANVVPDITSAEWGDKAEVAIFLEQLRRNAGNYACYNEGWPAPFQFGWGYTSGGTQCGTTGVFMDPEPTYIFNNSGAGNYGSPAVSDYPVNECGGGAGTITDYVHINREYYLYDGSFAGTTGIGSGARASRPASTTNGVAWWATDAGGDWNTTNGTANDGCLDVVVGGSWTNCVYTPYTYPHPLTTGSTPETLTGPAFGPRHLIGRRRN